MMKTSTYVSRVLNIRVIYFTLISVVIFSCKSGETIADKGIIQKRKYQKGYHVNIKSPFDSRNNLVHYAKIADESSTASLRASLPTNSIEPVLMEPIAKESKIIPGITEAKQTRKTKAKNKLENDFGDEATASLDELATWKSGENVYSNKTQIQNQP